jgi:predicted PurR-regulated permease PerM
MKGFFLSLFPGDVTDQVWQVLSDMSSAMGGYLRGAVLDGLILGAVTYVGLLIIGIDYPLILGVISGISEFLPVVGPIITTVIVVTVALFQSPTLALVAFAFLVVLQQIENHILVPNVMQTQTTVSPLLTILMVFAGGALGGLLGATIAIPLAAALRVLVVDVVAPGLRRLSGSEEQIGSHQGEDDEG